MKENSMPFDFQTLQLEAAVWEAKNFKQQKPHQPLLGVVEEVGELAHAHLKSEQGIRKDEDLFAKKIDAIGDIVIYLAHYCVLNGIDFHLAVYHTWQEVKNRDWVKFPINGKTK